MEREYGRAEQPDRLAVRRLCERYRDRGIAGRVRADVARQERSEALSRAEAPGAYVMAETLAGGAGLARYRSGFCDGRRYMTAADFDRYYHDRRGYRFPQYRSPDGGERAPAPPSAAERGAVQAERTGWLADPDRLPAPVRRLLRTRAGRLLNEWAGETFPRETEERRRPARARPIPAGILAALVTAAVSMSVVIGSTVLVSRSTREVSRLRESLSELREEREVLSDRLNLRNDRLDVRNIAVKELHMVPEKYLDAEYLAERREDSLEVYGGDADGRTSGWAAILSAFGFRKD